MINKYIDQLELPSSNNQQIKALKIDSHDALEIYIYYDYYKNLHLIIKSDGKINENRKGIRIKNEELDIISIGKNNFINFCCTSIDFRDKFIQIINEILEMYKTSNNLIKSINITVNKWYYFFEKTNSSDLNENVIKGLVGELIFIKDYLEITSDNKIINNWVGPNSAIRDFSFNTFDVEVKTSVKEVGHVHTINGGQQLQVENNDLLLFSISLKKSESESAITLKKLIDNITFKVCEDSFVLNEFYEKLELQHILVTDYEKYNIYKYEVKDVLTVKVNSENNNQFLIFNSNSRISNINYDIDLNGLVGENLIEYYESV